ncbi:hypothetical protein TPY_2771 [Sulfobacillus acidophilus TPY]|uniref:Uncharacterized protein n=1 Tax=Sulfobacillus acidophilus (strain ATCC 700253 / DSM 10332 / NAL) TaxID=679936 RepID=G8TU17_SULAD|nr:hypothetical protein TPY_2771 [Sulfobacillus acidophilus TPY]AEW04608.1 hypothetical protein Sulac_1108 [Sulfobacillus acidophilus DSM 10332]
MAKRRDYVIWMSPYLREVINQAAQAAGTTAHLWATDALRRVLWIAVRPSSAALARAAESFEADAKIAVISPNLTRAEWDRHASWARQRGIPVAWHLRQVLAWAARHPDAIPRPDTQIFVPLQVARHGGQSS